MTGSRRTAVLLAVLAVGVLAVGGLGYAAFTSSATLTTNASSGSMDLVFTAISLGAGTPGYIAISGESPTLPASTVSLDLGTFAPGDVAYLDFSVENTGTLKAQPLNVMYPGPGSTMCDTEWTAVPSGIPGSLAGGATFTTGVLTITFNGPTMDCPSPSTAIFVLEIVGTAA
jgi:hypothetical protein